MGDIGDGFRSAPDLQLPIDGRSVTFGPSTTLATPMSDQGYGYWARLPMSIAQRIHGRG